MTDAIRVKILWNGESWRFDITSRHKRSINAKTYNIDKWGKDPNHNILYITGMSGSGKSTAARSVADKNTDVIHLDIYLEPWMDSEETKIYQCKQLNDYLDRKNVPYKKLRDGSFKDRYNSKEWWGLVDKLQDSIEEFGKEQYSKNRKVVVEGVALWDETMYEDKTALRGKPVAIMKTGAVKSTIRATKRDIGDAFKLSDVPRAASIAYRKATLDRKVLKKLGKTVSDKKKRS